VHVERNLGRVGARLVRLTEYSHGRTGISYDLAHAWKVEAGECASVFYVRGRGTLAHTAVLLRERPFERYPRAWVKLRTARHPVRIAPAQIEADVLGTDFSFDDLRTWTPLPISSGVVETAREADHAVLAASWLFRRKTPVTARASVHLRHGLVTAADWLLVGASSPFKELRADGIGVVDGVAMPSSIAIRRPDEGLESRMELLLAATKAVALPAELFTTAGLTEATDVLEELPL
jgi:hypothetical protein